jgi:hypothetical protein
VDTGSFAGAYALALTVIAAVPGYALWVPRAPRANEPGALALANAAKKTTA